MIARRLLPLLGLLFACQKQTKPQVPEPPDLIAVVSVASPRAAVAGAAAYAEAVFPGAGASLRPELIEQGLAAAIGAPALEGLDLDQPTHLLVVDPKKHGGAVLLGKVTDEAKVRATSGVKVVVKDGRAVLGPEAAVDHVADHALGVVAARAAPAAVTVTCSPGKLVSLYRADIEAGRQAMAAQMAAQAPAMAKVIDVEIDLFLKLVEQTAEARLVLEAGAAEASLDLVLVPRPGTLFEEWTKAQKPGADRALLGRLAMPAEPTAIIVGNFQLGRARELALDLMMPLLEQALGTRPDRAKWSSWLDGLDGSLAAVTWSGSGGIMNLDEIIGADDGARAVAQARELFAGAAGPRTVDVMGMKMTWEAKPAAAGEGPPILGYEMRPDLTELPEPQRELMRRMYGETMRMALSGEGRFVALTLGPDAEERMPRLLEAARKGGPPALPPSAGAAIEAAGARKASMVMWMDLVRSMTAILPGPPVSSSGMSLELGVPDGAAHLRIGMPAAHMRELVTLMSGAGR